MKKTKEELAKELEGLIAKYGKGKIFTIETPVDQDEDSEEFYTVYLHAADRTQISMISKVMQNSNDNLYAIEQALRACYKGGDSLDEVCNNEDALFGCDIPIYKFLTKKNGVLKKN